ncbi:YneF family protein [Candidatus Xianfuyuplasma coldseepsis]|uniref:YneF family protein n=1 Tax=Candidatus Xianfuyuplasma coldseepsis TaxID=2782163 RepID=A0A7L7KSW0_9MOLU|nr:YneF family protein [Xianfuyuplasma coldseepsis]QMS85901.1 YneF family protein [Xianfuyuplasma coldseepsis]
MLLVNVATWALILYLVGALLVGGALGFYLSQRYFKKYLRENPPVNENMIRAMMMQMGRKPSEKQVRQVMQSMQNAK